MTALTHLDLLDGARSFGRWWRDELVGMVPLSWRERWTRSIPKAVIRPFADRVEVELIDGEAHRLLIDDAPLDGLDAEAWAQLDQVIRSRRTILVLSHPQSLVVHTSLPPGAVGHAGRVLELQLERLSPLKPEYIHWNWAVVPGPERAEAAVAMVRTETVEGLDRQFAEHGLPLPAIAAAHEPAPVHILAGHDGSDTPERRSDRRLGWISLALLLSIPLTTLVGLAIERRNTLASIERLEEEVGPRLRADARARRAAGAAAIARPLLARPSASRLIDRLALLLPDGSRLASLVIGPDGVATVTFEGASAETLEPLLTDAFREVTILSPEAAETIIADQAAPPVPAPAPLPAGAPTGPVRVTAEIRL